MCARPRPVIRLSFNKSSPLTDGRLPIHRQQKDGEILVELDPVSLSALLTSVGRPCTVEQAAEEIPGMARSSEQAPKSDTGPAGEGA